MWDTVLRRHRFVVGTPVQGLEGNQPILEIRLLNGQWLVCGPGPGDYRLRDARTGADAGADPAVEPSEVPGA